MEAFDQAPNCGRRVLGLWRHPDHSKGCAGREIRQNFGEIGSSFAQGNVSVGANGTGGGLVGFNSGIIEGASATGIVQLALPGTLPRVAYRPSIGGLARVRPRALLEGSIHR